MSARGYRCPRCAVRGRVGTIDSRHSERRKQFVIRRRREYRACLERWTTFEVCEDWMRRAENAMQAVELLAGLVSSEAEGAAADAEEATR